MNRRAPALRLSLLASVAVFALASAPVAAQQNLPQAPTPQTQKAGDPSRGARNDTGSATFVKQAAAADIAEIEMAKLALEKSQNASVRQFAQKMIDDHGRMSQQVQAAAARDQVAAGVPTQPNRAQSDTLAQLRKESGAGFDRAYVEAQVKGHQDAVALFETYVNSGADANLKKTASDALPHIKQHLRQAQTLQRQVQTAEVPADRQPAPRR